MRIIDHDPITRSTRVFHDNQDGSFVTATIQDVEPLVDYNKREYAAKDERSRWGEVSRVASIPPALWFELVRQGIAYDTKKLKAWLNDPDNRHFRTRPGRV